MTDQTLLQTYSDFVLSTYAPGLTVDQSIINCILSMIGEVAEWGVTVEGSQEELLEAGDVLYYLTQLLRELEIPVSFLSQDLSDVPFIDTRHITEILSDRTKKHFFWGSTPKYNRVGYIEEIKPALTKTLRNLVGVFDLQEIIEANIDKLTERKGIANPLRGDGYE